MKRFAIQLSAAFAVVTLAALPGAAAPIKPVMHHPAAHYAAAPVVRMVTTKGIILIKLFPKQAPISTANFEKLVKKGFYNGLMFHRVGDENDPNAPPGIAQGGDPNSRTAPLGDPSLGQGGPGYTIKGEFKANGVNNPLTHVAGAIAMARSGAAPEAPQADQVRAFNSAGSQFYICSQPVHFLDSNYAVFGQVIKGLDVAKRLKVGDRMTKVTMAQ